MRGHCEYIILTKKTRKLSLCYPFWPFLSWALFVRMVSLFRNFPSNFVSKEHDCDFLSHCVFINLRCIGAPDIFLIWFPGRSMDHYEMQSTLKGKNLLPGEQILSFKSWPPLLLSKVTKLFSLAVYLYTLKYYWKWIIEMTKQNLKWICEINVKNVFW